METVIGVFSSRERAEEAVTELLAQRVPEESIVFLSRSESEAKVVGKQLGASVGGFMGMATGASAGVAVATLLIPGIGPVFALGFGAAALLGLAGAGTGAAVGASIAETNVKTTPAEKAPEDVAFFRDVLKEGRSLILVRAESAETATVACNILDRTGLGMRGHTPVQTRISTRSVADVSIVDLSGRVTIGEGSVLLRDKVHELLSQGVRKILLNVHEVGYVDSSGIGTIVKVYTSVRGQGGHLKLVNPSKRLKDLLDMTKLSAVFEILPDEATAIQSFGASQKLAQG
jgi:anti-sigma B factor antagonist